MKKEARDQMGWVNLTEGVQGEERGGRYREEGRRLSGGVKGKSGPGQAYNRDRGGYGGRVWGRGKKRSMSGVFYDKNI